MALFEMYKISPSSPQSVTFWPLLSASFLAISIASEAFSRSREINPYRGLVPNDIIRASLLVIRPRFRIDRRHIARFHLSCIAFGERKNDRPFFRFHDAVEGQRQPERFFVGSRVIKSFSVVLMFHFGACNPVECSHSLM